jgi:RNA polymerase sigma factor (sigma-70 family)
MDTNTDITALEERCSVVVDQLLAKHGWQLLDRREFVRRAVSFMQDGTIIDPRYAAFGAYNQALYDACSGAEGIVQWELAYTELFRLLYDHARRYYPDVCEDATQIAIEHVCERFDRCREPKAFFIFATQQMMNAARSLRRQEQRQPMSIEISIGEDGDTISQLLVDPQSGPVQQLLADELQDEIQQFLAGYAQEHPRARKQIAALVLKYLDGLSDEAIGQQLGIPVKHVHVLRSRAVKRLREDARWRKLAVSLGIISPETLD